MKDKVRKITLLFFICSLTFFIIGCNDKDKTKKVELKAGESLIYVQKDGTITNKIVEEFDSKKYNMEDLKSDIEEEIKEFNSGSKDKKMSLESLNQEKNEAVLELKFPSYKEYAAYNKKYVTYGEKVVLFHGDIDEAVSDGYEMPESYEKADGEGKTDLNTLIGKNELKVIITNVGCKLQVDGEILYKSEDVKIEDGIAVTKDDSLNYIFYKKVEEEK